ncbi:MAG: hypothetical protein ACYS19_15160 [Planctomycetota bacterium]|jgi:hypothetical protein
MRKEGLTKLVGGIVLSLAIIFPLAGETYAASRIRSSTKTKSAKQSRKTIDLSALTPETPFAEAIDILRNSTKPPLNIIVFWRDLEENSDVDRHTPIGLEGVSGVSLGKNLELMLMSVSADPKSIGYVVENGVIIISTKDFLPTKRRVRIYDVTDLVGRPANYFSPLMGFGLMMPGMGYGSFYGGGRPYGYSMSSNVADLMDTLYGPSRRTRRNR